MFQSSDPTKKKFNALRRIIDNLLSRKFFFFVMQAGKSIHTKIRRKKKKKNLFVWIRYKMIEDDIRKSDWSQVVEVPSKLRNLSIQVK